MKPKRIQASQNGAKRERQRGKMEPRGSQKAAQRDPKRPKNAPTPTAFVRQIFRLHFGSNLARLGFQKGRKREPKRNPKGFPRLRNVYKTNDFLVISGSHLFVLSGCIAGLWGSVGAPKGGLGGPKRSHGEPKRSPRAPT